LLDRLQPDAVIIVPDPTWFDGLEVARPIRTSHPTIPLSHTGGPRVVSIHSDMQVHPVGEGLDELLATLDILLQPGSSPESKRPEPV
jgi:hypothetical protein